MTSYINKCQDYRWNLTGILCYSRNSWKLDAHGSALQYITTKLLWWHRRWMMQRQTITNCETSRTKGQWLSNINTVAALKPMVFLNGLAKLSSYAHCQLASTVGIVIRTTVAITWIQYLQSDCSHQCVSNQWHRYRANTQESCSMVSALHRLHICLLTASCEVCSDDTSKPAVKHHRLSTYDRNTTHNNIYFSMMLLGSQS